MFSNITNVGSEGVGLSLLIIFFILGFSTAFFLLIKKKLYVRYSFLYFLFFLSWVCLKIVIDLNEFSDLKSLTVASNGGIILFYSVGILSRLTSRSLLSVSKSNHFIYILLIFYTYLLFYLHFDFSQRWRTDLLLISDINGSYQRPGNFLSISFVILSYIVYTFGLIKTLIRKRLIILIILYTIQMILSVFAAQLFGSNSATVMVSGLYLITIIMMLVGRCILLESQGSSLFLPLKKVFYLNIFKSTVYTLFGFSFLLYGIFQFIGFDLNTIRIFGFGSGSSSSIKSRFDILTTSGLEQLNFNPLFGEMNVAYLVVGNSGEFIHSLFLNVFANFGVVGCFLFILLFLSVIWNLGIETASLVSKFHSINLFYNSISIYLFLIFNFVFIIGNLSTGFSWSVFWFVLGFVSLPFGFRSSLNNKCWIFKKSDCL